MTPDATEQRPWRQYVDRRQPSSLFLLKKRNYRIHAHIGFNTRSIMRKAVVLHTGAGSSFIKKGILPPSLTKRIQPVTTGYAVKDANDNPVRVTGTIALVVRIANRTEKITFNVVDGLATDVIIGCDYMDKHIEAIRPRRQYVEMEDGSTTPLLQRFKARQNEGQLPDVCDRPPKTLTKKDRRVKVVKTVTLQPGAQTAVEVQTDARGLVLIEPSPRLFRFQSCMASNGIAQVKPRTPFKILVANFGNTPVMVNAGQSIATVETHPSTIVESDISHAEVLGLVDNDTEYLGERNVRLDNFRRVSLNGRD